jgi:hypothetical protein
MGDVSFGMGSALDFNFDSGFIASDGLSLTFLTADTFSGFGDLSFTFNGLSSLFNASVINDTTYLSLHIASNDSTAVPEPPTLALFWSSLLGLLGLRRLRRHNKNRADLNRSAFTSRS